MLRHIPQEKKTVATKWVDKYIPDDVKDERFQRLNKKFRRKLPEINLKYVGRNMEVLVESFYNHKGKNINTGKTRNNKTVHIPCDRDLTGERSRAAPAIASKSFIFNQKKEDRTDITKKGD